MSRSRERQSVSLRRTNTSEHPHCRLLNGLSPSRLLPPSLSHCPLLINNWWPAAKGRSAICQRAQFIWPLQPFVLSVTDGIPYPPFPRPMGLFPFLSFTLVVARYDYEDEIYFKGAFLPNIHQLAEIIQSIVQVCSPLVPNPVDQNEETEPYSPDFMKVDENGESTRMISDEEYKRKAVGFL